MESWQRAPYCPVSQTVTCSSPGSFLQPQRCLQPFVMQMWGLSWDLVDPSPSLTPFLGGADRRDERDLVTSGCGCVLSEPQFPHLCSRALDPMTLLVSGAWAVQGWPVFLCCGRQGGGKAQKGMSRAGLMSPPGGRSWENTYMDGQRWEEGEMPQAQGNLAGDPQQIPTKVASRGRTVPWGASASSRARSRVPRWHLLKGPLLLHQPRGSCLFPKRSLNHAQGGP